MKIPKTTKRYCKHCKKYTEMTVSQSKKRNRGTLKMGSLPRLEKRGSGMAGFGNHGRFSKGPVSGFKRTGAKSSKKVDLRLKCKECNKSMVPHGGQRMKKPVFE